MCVECMKYSLKKIDHNALNNGVQQISFTPYTICCHIGEINHTSASHQCGSERKMKGLSATCDLYTPKIGVLISTEIL